MVMMRSDLLAWCPELPKAHNFGIVPKSNGGLLITAEGIRPLGSSSLVLGSSEFGPIRLFLWLARSSHKDCGEPRAV